jgi:tetratricopeptide (TPR) repeat protein
MHFITLFFVLVLFVQSSAQPDKSDYDKFLGFVETNSPYFGKLLSATPAYVDYDHFLTKMIQSASRDRVTEFIKIASRLATHDAAKLQQVLKDSEQFALRQGDFWWAHYLKFIAAIKAEDKQLFEKYFNELMTKKPDSPQAWMEAFYILRTMKMYDHLPGQLQECVQAFPNYAPAHYELGVIYMNDGKNDQAMEYFQNSLRINPQLKEAYNNIGSIYLSQNEITKAVEAFNKALDIDNKFSKAWNNRGFASYLSGSFNEAVNDFNKAIEIEPDYGYAFYGRGLARIELNDKNGGCGDIKRALDLGLTGAQAAFAMYCK